MKFLDPDALNGYVAFPKRKAPKIPRTANGIVRYIPVHGGVTWGRKDGFACVWGFDTGHHNSLEVPRTDPDWIMKECLILLAGIRKAEELFPRYKRAGREERLEIGQMIYDVADTSGKRVMDVISPFSVVLIAKTP